MILSIILWIVLVAIFAVVVGDATAIISGIDRLGILIGGFALGACLGYFVWVKQKSEQYAADMDETLRDAKEHGERVWIREQYIQKILSERGLTK